MVRCHCKVVAPQAWDLGVLGTAWQGALEVLGAQQGALAGVLQVVQ